MSKGYVVLGAGRQGVAAAFDLVKNGGGLPVVLADLDGAAAQRGAGRVRNLAPGGSISAQQVDVRDDASLHALLSGSKAVVAAIHYALNEHLTKACIAAKTSMCDLGGNTDVARRQFALDADARAAGVTIVPDCGMAPGLNMNMGLAAMDMMDTPRDLRLYSGGLVQDPPEPWRYLCNFAISGLTNEYDGDADVIENGEIGQVACFLEPEELDMPRMPAPYTRLEAFITSGGLSTMPWAVKDRLRSLRYKTFRLPGHRERFVHYQQLGLFGLEAKDVRGQKVVPRDLFHVLLDERLGGGPHKDLGVILARCNGTHGGKPAEAVIEVIDRFDEATGFTAMERLTGFHVAMMAAHSASGSAPAGAHPVFAAIPAQTALTGARTRGLNVQVISSPR